MITRVSTGKSVTVTALDEVFSLLLISFGSQYTELTIVYGGIHSAQLVVDPIISI